MTTYHRFTLALALWASMAAGSAAQQTESLLQKYRKMAVAYNHDLKAADKHVAASIEMEKAAHKDLYPTLVGGGEVQYTAQPLQLTLQLPSMEQPMTFTGKDLRYGITATLLQPVYTGGQLMAAIDKARRQHRLSTYEQEYIRAGIYLQTDVQYWNTVARAEIVAIAADHKRSVEELAKTIRERVEAGLTDPQDQLMVEVKLNEAQYRLLQAQGNLDNGRMVLNALIGVNLRTATEIADSVETVDDTDPRLWTDHHAPRPEEKMALQQVRMAETDKQLVASRYRPHLYVGVDGSYSSPGYNFRSDLDANCAVYAKLSVPLFEWGKRRNERRAAEQRIGMAEDRLGKTCDDINLEIQTARNSLRKALEQVNLARNSLDKAKANEAMALERYDEGKASVIEVIDAQTYRQTAQLSHVQAKVEAQNHYAQLLKAKHLYGEQP